jgi:light-regulated signal transduction histidine kinase (bacteriophytochrome)
VYFAGGTDEAIHIPQAVQTHAALAVAVRHQLHAVSTHDSGGLGTGVVMLFHFLFFRAIL